MHNDIRGLPVTAASADAVAAFDHAIDAYLGYRSDIMARMEALFAADPACGMAHVLKGYLILLGYKSQLVPVARAAAETAAPLLRHATPREEAHLQALIHWSDGDPDKASAVWEAILRESSARSARVPIAPLHQLLVRPAGRHVVHRAQRGKALVRLDPGLQLDPRLPLLRA